MKFELIKNSDIVLIMPPVWDYSFQSLGIPCLQAWLMNKGYKASKIDLNIEFARTFSKSKKIDTQVLEIEYKKIINDPSFVKNYMPNKDEEYIRIDLPFGYSYVVNCNYSKISKLCEDQVYNVYISFLKENNIIERIAGVLSKRSKLIGMTIEGENQVISALTIANLFKKFDHNIKIVIGGPWVTQHNKDLMREKKILSEIDYFIPGKGEIPLTNLIEALKETQNSIKSLDGIISKVDDSFSGEGLKKHYIKPIELPPPELFPIDNYIRNTVLPYESARGCYWGRCKFCHHVQHYKRGYQVKPINKVINELLTYKSKYNFKIVSFTDAAIPPRRVKDIANAFIEKKLNLKWAMFCKVSEKFNKELFALAYNSGLDTLSIGIETVSSRLSEYIGKPIDREIALKTLKASHQAGIHTSAGIINGFPGETFDDLKELELFLEEIGDFIYTYPKLLRLEKGSEFYKSPEKYNIKILERDNENRLSVYYQFIDLNNNNEIRKFIMENNINRKWFVKYSRKMELDWKTSKNKNFSEPIVNEKFEE